ncbi:IS3 family transposase [Azotobacter chroococcum]|uniref:IS3 family transposase n=1 Tax=Azotobacter chroococcum TaxID=353 RepID=UPI000B786979|nr:IS3 family transposase [Azotobacter chroococcum]
MARQASPMKPTRIRHSQAYKDEALALAERIGVSKAAEQLGLHPSQLYGWRSRKQQAQTSSEREQLLADENARLKRLLAEQSEELAIGKKSRRVLCQEPQVKYAFMQAHTQQFPLKVMCRVLGIARSGYYAWCSRKLSKRRQQQTQLDRLVAQAYHKRKGRSGAPRLCLDLKASGLPCNRKTVTASMRRQGLRARAARKFKATTNSRHSLPVADNLLRQGFTAAAPNRKWVGDMTYLHTEEGWLYLAVIIDLYSRRVIGWAMGERMTAELVCDALRMALWRRKQPQGVIVHTDRGSQYCSAAYRELLHAHRLRGSMSAKGNCYDNACAESFFHSLKVECIHGERFGTHAQMRQTVFEYIETDYNRQRRHSTLGYISPEAFEAWMSA